MGSFCCRHVLVALSHFGVHSTPGGTPCTHSTPGIFQCIRYIVQNEGTRALFKGLGPNLVGVAPSRAIYFCAYSKSKVAFNTILPADTPIVHVFSAFCAGKSLRCLLASDTLSRSPKEDQIKRYTGNVEILG